MNAAIVRWLLVRALRWLAWIGFFAYSLHFAVDRESHVDSFSRLLLTTEAALFGFGLAALFLGFIELLMRDWAGLERAELGRLFPPYSR
jgi:hypothetical protein